METTPSPRPSGERVGARGFEPVNIGLLTRPSPPSGKEREKNSAGVKTHPDKTRLATEN